MDSPDFPQHILNDIRAIVPKFTVSWHRWEDSEGVCPLIGLPFERVKREDGSYLCTCSIHPMGKQQWVIDAKDAPEGRFILFEENNGHEVKLFDIVYHDCSPIDPVQNRRIIVKEVAGRIGMWREAEKEILSREKKQREREMAAAPFEERVSDAAADAFRRGEGFSQVSVPGLVKTKSGIIVPTN